LLDRKPQEEKRLSANNASFINEAFHTLKHPFTRAVYMLELSGNSFGDELVIDDVELLSELLEDREAASELECDKLTPLRNKYEKLQSDTMRGLVQAFNANDTDKARKLAYTLSYQCKIIDDIRARQPVT
jgi:molecular chaperone HscB